MTSSNIWYVNSKTNIRATYCCKCYLTYTSAERKKKIKSNILEIIKGKI